MFKHRFTNFYLILYLLNQFSFNVKFKFIIKNVSLGKVTLLVPLFPYSSDKFTLFADIFKGNPNPKLTDASFTEYSLVSDSFSVNAKFVCVTRAPIRYRILL